MKTLNDYQLDRLLTTGFVHVPQLIDAAAVDCALEAINSDLAVSGLDPSRFVDYEGTSFCSEIRYDPAITNLLYKSAVWPVLEDLFGVGRVAPRKRGQIALRFPERATQRQEKLFSRPHIDGFSNPGNSISPKEMHCHSLLAAVHLSDVIAENQGNFTAWPGTHLVNSRHYREHGMTGFSHGYSQTTDSWREQILCRRGDVTLIHYLTGHHPAPNLSPNIRYTVLFRMSTIGLDERRDSSVRDLWSEWDGLLSRRPAPAR